MTDLSQLQAALQSRLASRSMGLKLIVVCGLALLMAIPAFFVSGIIEDRNRRAAEVVREITSHVGGQQIFLGPTLAVPYTIPARTSTAADQHGVYLVFPKQAS